MATIGTNKVGWKIFIANASEQPQWRATPGIWRQAPKAAKRISQVNKYFHCQQKKHVLLLTTNKYYFGAEREKRVGWRLIWW